MAMSARVFSMVMILSVAWPWQPSGVWCSLPQLNSVIECATNTTGDYLLRYGCHCGFTVPGAGHPASHMSSVRVAPSVVVDQVDQCCQVHRACYDTLLPGDRCGMSAPYLVQYTWECTVDRQGRRVPDCSNWGYVDQEGQWGRGPRCQRALCECDRGLALCLAQSPYPPPEGTVPPTCPHTPLSTTDTTPQPSDGYQVHLLAPTEHTLLGAELNVKWTNDNYQTTTEQLMTTKSEVFADVGDIVVTNAEVVRTEFFVQRLREKNRRLFVTSTPHPDDDVEAAFKKEMTTELIRLKP